MKLTIASLVLAGAIVVNARQGLPARSDAGQYTANAEAGGAVVAAALIPADQVRNEFATPLVPRYQVMEVAVYPGKGLTAEVTTLDFGLRVDGRLIRPASSETIAAILQKRGNRRSKDVVLWPHVGVGTGGGYGTRTNVGVGAGIGGLGGGGNPRPASTDQDRRVMTAELEERALHDVTTDKPVAGYLYFPTGDTKAKSVELVYQHDAGEMVLKMDLPKTK